MKELIATVGERIRRASAVEDPEARVLAVLSELMPLTPATRDEAFAHLQFALQARIDPRLAAIADASFDAIHDVCAQVVGWLVVIGELPGATDVAALASTLRALVDGLTFELLLAPHLLAPDEALELLRRQLRAAPHREEEPTP